MRRRPIFSRAVILDAATRVMILVVLLVVAYVLVQYRTFSECVATYDDATAAATQARAAAADRDRAAEDAMWQAISDAGDPKVVPPAQAQQYAKDAFVKFLEQRRQAKEDRAKHPFPQGPSKVCK